MSPVRSVLSEAAQRLAAAGIDSARLDARVLLAKVVGVGSGEILALSRELTPAELAQFDGLLARREAREPLAYIIGTKEFWSLDFVVGPGALVPRPETETLIEEALKEFADRAAPLRILDLGTGSGCLLVTALTLYPNATGTGLDISEEALVWARRNATRHGVTGRCVLSQGSWVAAENAGPFDLILSNPPYLASYEMDDLAPELVHEPPGALESGPEGLEAFRALGTVISAVLAPAGRAILEIGAGQGALVAAVLGASGLKIARIAPDLAGIPRAVVAGPR